MPSRSCGICPSTTVRSSASHSLVCGRHGPVRYGWSSAAGRVDRNVATTSTSISRSFGRADDETHGGRGAAAEVQRAKGFRALDLVVAGRPADLFGRVDAHPNSRAPGGGPPPDPPPAGVDRQPPADLDLAVFNGLPRF